MSRGWIARRGQLGSALLSAMLLSGSAIAQQNAPAADALFRAGRDAMKAGRLNEACEKFQESNRLQPAPGTALNLGLCEEKRGHLTVAWGLLEQAARELPDGDPRTKIASDAAARVGQRLPRLTIRLAPSSPADVQVLRDDTVLTRASFGTPLPVDPGETTLVVRASGYFDVETQVTLKEGERREVEVRVGAPQSEPELAPAPAPAETPAPPATPADPGPVEADGGDTQPAVGWVVAGLGTVSLGVGVVTGLMVINRKNTVDSECDSDGFCSQEGLDAADQGRTLSPVSTITFVAGAAGLGLGLYLILSADGDEAPPAAALQVAPLRGGAGLQLHSRF